jgi:hypothetical protein
MGGNVAISRLESCPKCKGRLLLEKDNYGSYQQCLQCGYIHDLETITWIDEPINDPQAEEEKEAVAPYRVTRRHSQDISQNTPRLFESSHSTALADPLDLQIILDALHKRYQDQAQ